MKSDDLRLHVLFDDLDGCEESVFKADIQEGMREALEYIEELEAEVSRLKAVIDSQAEGMRNERIKALEDAIRGIREVASSTPPEMWVVKACNRLLEGE